MAKRALERLSRRERQIMELIYASGQATATEILDRLPDPPSYSAVRALLRILETKGHVRHVVDGTRYVFLPTVAPDRARRSAMQSVIHTFFEGSPEKAVAALLDVSRSELSEDELDRISRLIENAREEGR
ncbi:MAG: BlaI/MecI/CopY family transcriptional regulator [Acidobacteria bacterium]|nr:BlaI/MecI/CopY family transcriptional regulator [Acidobacteriota bacterium]MCA1612139.1 BlaI/MecI/CopY family transcriptional regulator [Acidobacteriota bacterium]